MDLTSSDSQTDSTPAVPNPRWSLAGTHPGRLALRLTAAALGVGAVGGMVTACLSLLVGSTASTATRVVAIALPLFLVAMIGWHLAAVTDHGSPPSARSFVRVTAAGFALIAVAQVLSKAIEFDGLDGTVLVLLWVLVYGGAFGLAPPRWPRWPWCPPRSCSAR